MDLSNALHRIADVVDASNGITTALVALRAGYSDEEWEALEEAHPLIADVISACCELEYELER